MMSNGLIPAGPTNIVPWVLKTLQGGPLHRDQLFVEVAKLAKTQGFNVEDMQALKKALDKAKRHEQVDNTRPGWWKLPAFSEVTEVMEAHQTEGVTIRFCKRSIVALRTIGQGEQVVYVLYSKPHAEIARRDNQAVWRCKVGMTKAGLGQRMFGGGSNTFMSEEPILGLVIKCEDAASVETMLHKSLRIAGRWINEGDRNEWFMTSPDLIATFYKEWFKLCNTLRA